MARLRLQCFSSISWLGILLFWGAVLLAQRSNAAAGPPTGENAYCEKGNSPHFGDKDGVAELPKACYYTALDGTPSPGKQIRVDAKEDLAAAVKNAKCGDILLLPAGAEYGLMELPAKKCDDSHYITIRTDTPDSKLPPEGTRISPAWAGVATLPGRPSFAQPAGGAAKLMATIVVRNNSGVPVGDHVRFIGIEWTSHADTAVNRLITAEHGDHVIFDRNYIHPGEGAEVAHGIGMVEGSNFIAVINSYVSGLYCMARTGKCTDATAVGGARSDEPFGTFKIYNNFLEASGQNIMFGGAASTNNPSDIEIRRNHLFRPITWRPGEPGYTPSPSGTPFIVKNNFELKSAVRVLFEANLLENSWGGFTQTGFSILITAVSQASHCPTCRVNDITMRYNRVRNVAGVFQIAAPPAPEKRGGGSAADAGRFSIHDLVADNVHSQDYKGGGLFLMFSSNKVPVHDLQIDHVTAFVPGILVALISKGDKLQNFNIVNSVFAIDGGRRPAIAAAGGGPQSCVYRSQRLGAQAVLDACFATYKFDHNLIITDSGGWPPQNIIVKNAEGAGIRELTGTSSKDPRLCQNKGPGCPGKSPGAGAAADGRDLGADVDAVEAAIAGVE